MRDAKIGCFKPIADFDWSWPKKIDREAVEELFRFEFLGEAANVVLNRPCSQAHRCNSPEASAGRVSPVSVTSDDPEPETIPITCMHTPVIVGLLVDYPARVVEGMNDITR